MPFSVFADSQGHKPGFTKIVVSTFQKKAVTFEVKQLEPSNFPFYTLYDAIESRNCFRFSMWKIEHAEGAAILHTLPPLI